MPRMVLPTCSSVCRPTSVSGWSSLLVALTISVGCVENWKGTDLDGDGFGVFEGDCWDSLDGPPGSGLTGADIRPDATETWYDGIDQNCDGMDDFDPDGDGWVKDEEHLNKATLGLPDSGTNHVGSGDCYNTPDDINPSVVDTPFTIDDSVESVDITAVDPASVHPDAVDVWYDGVDSNCDTLDDYDADADGDRSRDEGDGLDCDDTDPIRAGIFDEVCDPDGVDEDCDELVNGADDSVDPETAFEAFDDADGDLFGDPAAVQVVCDLPDGTVANGLDCNDADSAINPDADEICDDSDVDENCNGVANDADSDVVYSADDEAWTDADGDNYGDPNARVEICDPGEGLSTNDGDCDDTNADVNPAATEICNGIDDDCVNGADDDDPAVDLSTGTTYYADSDGDNYGDTNVDNAVTACDLPEGYTTAADALDCNDADAAVNPDATEVCNDYDDDCNGDVDDGDAGISYGSGDIWYEDDDGDTFGNTASTQSSCDQPSGYVRDNTDCDDTRDDVNPGEDEVCDDEDIDEDCNRQVDDDDAGVIGPFTDFYLDDDGDTFGDPSVSVSQCDAPADYVTDNTDCDDSDNSVNPDATEVCDEFDVDEDCDELINDADPSVDVGTFDTFYRDSDSDTYGDAGVTTAACDAPSGYVADDQDCDDSNEDVNPAATEVCNGIDDDCVNGADDDDVNVDTSTFSTFYLDDDGDDYGLDSTTVSACDAPSGYTATAGDCDDDEASTYPGAPETCNDGIDSDCEPATCLLESDDIEDAADVIWRGANDSDTFGYRVLAAPDLDGDGNPDVVASAYFESFSTTSGNRNFAGRVRVGASLETAELDDGTDSVVNASVTINGQSNADRMGTGLTAGDFNGDGNADLIVGAVFGEDSGNGADGAAYLLLGPLGAGTIQSGSSDAITYGQANSDNLGWYSAAGDIDGNAFADLAISAPQCEASSFVPSNTGTSAGAGQVYVLPGAAATTWFDTALGTTTAARFDGTTTGDCAGHSVVLADVDKDGIDELIVGAPFAGTGGELYVADTTQTGVNALSNEITLRAWGANHEIGSAIATNDFNDDGYDDLIVGAPGLTSDDGGVYIIYGSTSSDVSAWNGRTVASEAYATISPPLGTKGQFGYSVSSGDFDNDGEPDLIAGARLEDPGGVTNAGSVWVVHGPLSGSVTLDATTDAKFTGSSATSFVGTSVSSGQDLNNDGFDDIIVGAFAAEDSSGDAPGATYVLFGRGN